MKAFYDNMDEGTLTLKLEVTVHLTYSCPQEASSS